MPCNTHLRFLSLFDSVMAQVVHDDIIKWRHFQRYWPFVRGIHRSPVNSPHKGQWHRAFMFSLICAWTNSWVNNRDAGDLRCHHTHYDVIVMRNPSSCQTSAQLSYIVNTMAADDPVTDHHQTISSNGINIVCPEYIWSFAPIVAAWSNCHNSLFNCPCPGYKLDSQSHT